MGNTLRGQFTDMARAGFAVDRRHYKASGRVVATHSALITGAKPPGVPTAHALTIVGSGTGEAPIPVALTNTGAGSESFALLAAVLVFIVLGAGLRLRRRAA